MAEKIGFIGKIKANKFLKNKHIVRTAVIALLCIVVLLVVSCFSSTKPKTENTLNTTSVSNSSAIEYANLVSSNLQNIVNNIKGISNARVMVVVEESPTIKYLTETNSSSGEVTIVYDKQGSTYRPVAIAELLPKITGILVVAKGVSDLTIKYNLLNAISVVYNIDVSCIDILEGK